MRQVAEAVLALSAAPTGFTSSDLALQVRSPTSKSESEYGVRRAAYDIKKLRAKGMVRKTGESRRYETIPEGLRSLTALLVLREKNHPDAPRRKHTAGAAGKTGLPRAR
jgi:hypothetical protein